MDAVTFIKERKRMCQSMEYCAECPAHIEGNCYVGGVVNERSPETQVTIVEEWAFMYPNKTRQSEYLKMFPKAKLDNDKVLTLCPRSAGGLESCPYGDDGFVEWCSICRRNYWSTIIEKEE